MNGIDAEVAAAGVGSTLVASTEDAGSIFYIVKTSYMSNSSVAYLFLPPGSELASASIMYVLVDTTISRRTSKLKLAA